MAAASGVVENNNTVTKTFTFIPLNINNLQQNCQSVKSRTDCGLNVVSFLPSSENNKVFKDHRQKVQTSSYEQTISSLSSHIPNGSSVDNDHQYGYNTRQITSSPSCMLSTNNYQRQNAQSNHQSTSQDCADSGAASTPTSKNHSSHYITINLKQLAPMEHMDQAQQLASIAVPVEPELAKALMNNDNVINEKEMEMFLEMKEKQMRVRNRNLENKTQQSSPPAKKSSNMKQNIFRSKLMKRRRHLLSLRKKGGKENLKLVESLPESQLNKIERKSWQRNFENENYNEHDQSYDDNDTTMQSVEAPMTFYQELLRKCRHSAFYITSEEESMWKNPYQIRSANKEDIELANALGISAEALQPEKVAARKCSIQSKLREKQCTFSIEEEFDIHCRAEAYAVSVVPDPDYFVPCGKQPPMGANSLAAHLWPFPRPGRRRRKVLSMVDSNTSVVQNHVYPYYTYCITTTDGTQLLKPPAKLVELVAQAINDSPDGMLQVQQVYMALQGKYPYFQHFDKSSQTSWKSSIRHALYQKWFVKVDYFSTDFISIRGCYWAINRHQSPKDWHLPPVKTDLTRSTVSRTTSRTKKTEGSPKGSLRSKGAKVMEPKADPTEAGDEGISLPQNLSFLDNSLSTACGYTLDTVFDELESLEREASENSTSGSSNIEIRDPDPILNELNMLTQSSECEDQLLESAHDQQLELVGDDVQSLCPSNDSDTGTWDCLNPDDTDYTCLGALGLISAQNMDEQLGNLDLYMPLLSPSHQTPFYIAVPLDESVEIFNVHDKRNNSQ